MAQSCSQDRSGHEPTTAPSAVPGGRRGVADCRTPQCDIDAENRDLEQGRRAKFEAYSQSKNQGLLELNRLVPALGGATIAGPLRDSLNELHAKLEINRRALAMQLKACEAVSEIIARAIQDGQSDGTYTALAWNRARE
jgi:hypothetical protein